MDSSLLAAGSSARQYASQKQRGCSVRWLFGLRWWSKYNQVALSPAARLNAYDVTQALSTYVPTGHPDADNQRTGAIESALRTLAAVGAQVPETVVRQPHQEIESTRAAQHRTTNEIHGDPYGHVRAAMDAAVAENDQRRADGETIPPVTVPVMTNVARLSNAARHLGEVWNNLVRSDREWHANIIRVIGLSMFGETYEDAQLHAIEVDDNHEQDPEASCWCRQCNAVVRCAECGVVSP